MPKAALAYAKLISDPCYGPLVRSVGGGGEGSIIERVRSTVTFPSAAANTSGYVVWYPEFTGKGNYNSYASGNCFAFENASASVRPTNTLPAPMGKIAIDSTGYFIPDPMLPNLVSASAFARSKTLAACIQLEYISKLSDCSGQIAVIQNYSLAAFDQNSGVTGSEFQPPSVNEIFAYASERDRLQLDGAEIKWCPSDDSSKFRTSEAENIGVTSGSATLADAVFWIGSTAVEVTKLVTPNPQLVHGICIAWRGIAPTANCLSMNLVKVGDLELAARNNAIENPRATSDDTSIQTTISQVVSYLDGLMPQWQRVAGHTATRMISDYVSAVYAPPGLARNIGKGLRNSHILRIEDGVL